MYIFTKEITKMMKSIELHMDIICNIKIIDYLDLTFNLNGGSYKKNPVVCVIQPPIKYYQTGS